MQSLFLDLSRLQLNLQFSSKSVPCHLTRNKLWAFFLVSMTLHISSSQLYYRQQLLRHTPALLSRPQAGAHAPVLPRRLPSLPPRRGAPVQQRPHLHHAGAPRASMNLAARLLEYPTTAGEIDLLQAAREVLFHRKTGGSSHQLTIIAAPFLTHKTKG